MKKLMQQFRLNPKVKKSVAIAMACMFILTVTSIMAFAEETTSADLSNVTSGITTIFGNLTSTFNFTTIIAIIGIPIGAAALLYLAWWGVRKAVAMMKSALKGKLNL